MTSAKEGHNPRAGSTDFCMGGERSHRGGTQGGGQQSDGGGIARDSRQNQYGTITRVENFNNKLCLG